MRFVFQECSVREFSRRKGIVFAPVHIDPDMSDYVRVNKFDLIRQLRHYEKTRVTYYLDANDELVFV